MKTLITTLAGLMAFALPIAAQTTAQPTTPNAGQAAAGAGFNAEPNQWFRQLDLNGDGIVSKEEFAHYRILNGTFAPSQPGANVNSPSNTTTATTNVDGSFQSLDTNGDGTLSTQEFARAPSIIGTTSPNNTVPNPNSPTPNPVTPNTPAPIPTTPSSPTPNPTTPSSPTPNAVSPSSAASGTGTVNTSGTGSPGTSR